MQNTRYRKGRQFIIFRSLLIRATLKRKEDLKDLASKKRQGKNNVKASKLVVRNEIRVQTFGKLIQIHVGYMSCKIFFCTDLVSKFRKP
jgi:hypothetical protein